MPCPICHWARWPSACLTNQPLCVVLELCPLPGRPVTPPNTLQPHLCAAFLPTLSGVAPCCSISVCSSEWSGEHLPPCRRRAHADLVRCESPCRQARHCACSPGAPSLLLRVCTLTTCSYWWQRQVAVGQPQRCECLCTAWSARAPAGTVEFFTGVKSDVRQPSKCRPQPWVRSWRAKCPSENAAFCCRCVCVDPGLQLPRTQLFADPRSGP